MELQIRGCGRDRHGAAPSRSGFREGGLLAHASSPVRVSLSSRGPPGHTAHISQGGPLPRTAGSGVQRPGPQHGLSDGPFQLQTPYGLAELFLGPHHSPTSPTTRPVPSFNGCGPLINTPYPKLHLGIRFWTNYPVTGPVLYICPLTCPGMAKAHVYATMSKTDP